VQEIWSNIFLDFPAFQEHSVSSGRLPINGRGLRFVSYRRDGESWDAALCVAAAAAAAAAADAAAAAGAGAGAGQPAISEEKLHASSPAEMAVCKGLLTQRANKLEGWVIRCRGPRCLRGEVLLFLYQKSL
jgi:hypothetical protein